MFDAGEAAYRDVQDILMRRYGYECVSRCWWAAEVAARAGVPMNSTEKEEAVAR